jgi:hypothetical protein
MPVVGSVMIGCPLRRRYVLGRPEESALIKFQFFPLILAKKKNIDKKMGKRK